MKLKRKLNRNFLSVGFGDSNGEHSNCRCRPFDFYEYDEFLQKYVRAIEE